jgi:hypothetical protein
LTAQKKHEEAWEGLERQTCCQHLDSARERQQFQRFSFTSF